MIDSEKLNMEELADVILEVQRWTGYRFDVVDAYEIARHTIRKADLNGKDESYVPILLKNEPEDFLMRKQINFLGRLNYVRNMLSSTLPSSVPKRA